MRTCCLCRRQPAPRAILLTTPSPAPVPTHAPQSGKLATSPSGKTLAATQSGKAGGLMVKEDQEVGQVTGRVYRQYISAYGVLSAVLLILFWSGEQVGRVGAVGVGVPRVPASLGCGGGGAAVCTAASACCRPGPDCSLALLPLSPACRLPSCLAPQTLRILTSWYLSKWSGAEVMARYTGAPS